ncbi:MAG: C1 family peptidase [Candidatus Amulumruptor caecigallinarius]|nr:C1 family peptidase [Candidatus Amulumruptor caecigallinarius]MCM1396829.1 C1 family peptidase [Candidatus Amulumruptor caecigallinarius]MCM1454227.1 C1 family peptidase [bacterium]
MNKFLALMLAGAIAPCAMATGFDGSGMAGDDKIVIPDSTGFKFTDVITIKTTPVKDQNKSGTCWSFSGISFLEDEILGKTGEEVDLSEMFVVRHCYDAKADRYVRMHGQTPLAAGGSILDVPWVWQTFGIVPEEAYTGLNYGEDKHVHGELDAGLKGYLDAVTQAPNRTVSTAWKKGENAILDAYLGELPATFTVGGKTYTPRSYADRFGLDMNDYMAVSSFTHHPYYESFILEVPDNWINGRYVNLPLEEMKQAVDASLAAGHSVLWAADVSEGGFKWRNGYAVLPKAVNEADLEGTELSRWVQLSDSDRKAERYDIKGPVAEETVTAESRQKGFDNYETTDDHGMVIVGTAVDQEGNKYYKVKNSWDTNQLYGGFFYVSEPYFLAKTISIMLNKNTLPKEIAKKIMP